MLLHKNNPDIFHGFKKKKHFFEGWYFKLCDPGMKESLSFIPGIFLGNDANSSHSFIQVLRGKTSQLIYSRMPSDSFHAEKNSFFIKIDSNSFSLSGITLNLPDVDLKIKGGIDFSQVKKWPDSALNPGSMGYYNFLPNMQCYSQVCAMSVNLSGKLIINKEEIDFTNGKGYIEKNWGRSFPYSWIWVQCNSFKNFDIAISCSIGHVPFLFSSFKGFLIGLYFENDFYKFTTINKSRLTIKECGNDVVIKTENNRYSLVIETYTEKDKFILCKGPIGNNMVPLVKENLMGKVKVTMFDKLSGKLLFYDEGNCSGIEYGGDKMYMAKDI